MPATPGWIVWCPGCNWNLSAPAAPVPKTRFERAYLRAGDRLGRRVSQTLEAAPSLEPRWTPSKAAAVAIAVCVHALTLAIAALGIGFIVVAGLPGVPFGALFLAVAWLMRPRLGRPPKEDLVSRTQAPTLFGLIDEVAAALSTPAPDLLVVNDHFNAFWNVVGIRFRRVLGLGLPLFDSLAPQERVALIGHELGHGRNGDVRRGHVVQSAVAALNSLYTLLAPGSRVVATRRDPWLAAAEPLANAIMYVLTRPLAGLIVLQANLMWQDSQRAEYLADALAARVAGTEAEIGLTERLLHGRTFEVVARKAMHGLNDATVDVFAEARVAMEGIPAEERERLRRVARLEQTRLDATHPPPSYRLALLERRAPLEPAVVLDAERSAKIDDELAPLRAHLSLRIVDAYRSSLYAGGRRRRRR